MRISIICFSGEGAALAKRAASFYRKTGREAVVYTSKNRADEYGLLPALPDLKMWAKQQFSSCSALLFIGACGIAVRAIAPWIESKETDPAVFVLDDGGRFLISLLSGHLGGANELTEELAAELGAEPIVTTATDRRGVWAVDTWAKRSGCRILDMKLAKEVSARLLRGETVGFYSQFPVEGTLPDGLVEAERIKGKAPVGIMVGISREPERFEKTLVLVPTILTVGVGCRKHTKKEQLEGAVDALLEQHGFYREAVGRIASVDLKKEELGILQMCEERRLEFMTFSAERLNALEGEFTRSDFVRQVAGVDCVCERSALCAAPGGKLLVKKTIFPKVTAAVAAVEWSAAF